MRRRGFFGGLVMLSGSGATFPLYGGAMMMHREGGAFDSDVLRTALDKTARKLGNGRNLTLSP